MKFGQFEVFALSDGRFALDGGAMFGVVPRVFWQKTNPPDERNRITLALRPLLIKTPEALVLVDTGIGTKQDQKFRDIYRVEQPPHLLDTLRHAGFRPEDVTHVVNTHLHFDHAGNDTILEPQVNASERESGVKETPVNASERHQTELGTRNLELETLLLTTKAPRHQGGSGPEGFTTKDTKDTKDTRNSELGTSHVVPAFPKAKYIVQEKEWQMAMKPDVRSKASYLPENFMPVFEAGQLMTVDGEVEFTPGVRVVHTGGHTPGHQIVIVRPDECRLQNADCRLQNAGCCPSPQPSPSRGEGARLGLQIADCRLKIEDCGIVTTKTPRHQDPDLRAVASETDSVERPAAGGERQAMTLIYWGDLIPTASHVNVPYVMGYDTTPLVTIEQKEKLLERVVTEHWLMCFEHDPEIAFSCLRFEGGKYVLDEPVRDVGQVQ